LKTDIKARYQGYQFFFKEGFCWIDVNSTYLKARLKEKGVFDVISMTLFTKMKLPDYYFVCLINSDLISKYVDNFINNTSHFQINDARQLPIIIPSEEQLKTYNILFEKLFSIKKYSTPTEEIESSLLFLQEKINMLTKKLYEL
jgi:hypothetical protein